MLNEDHFFKLGDAAQDTGDFAGAKDAFGRWVA
jgi:hypothetical protein